MQKMWYTVSSRLFSNSDNIDTAAWSQNAVSNAYKIFISDMIKTNIKIFVSVAGIVAEFPGMMQSVQILHLFDIGRIFLVYILFPASNT